VPFFGLAVAWRWARCPASSPTMAYDDNFIKQTREKVTEGTSALFLLTSGAVQDKVVEAFKGQTFEILSTNLPKAKEDELRAAFGRRIKRCGAEHGGIDVTLRGSSSAWLSSNLTLARFRSAYRSAICSSIVGGLHVVAIVVDSYSGELCGDLSDSVDHARLQRDQSLVGSWVADLLAAGLILAVLNAFVKRCCKSLPAA